MRRVPWTSQPPYPVGIDWSNPITRGIVSAVNFSIDRDVFGRNIVYVNSPVKTINCAGRGFLTNGSTSYGLVSLPNKTYNKITLVSLSVPTSLSASAAVISLGSSSSSYPIFRISLGNTTPSKVRFWMWGDDGGTLNSTTDSTNTAFVIGKPSVVAFYAKGSSGDCYVYINGKKDPSATTTIANTWTIDRFSFGNTYYGGSTTNFYSGSTNLGIFYDRELSPSEHLSLANNPWQIFEPYTVFDNIPFPIVTAQFARPVSDVSAGTWTSSLGGSLSAAIDETTASDSDYITTTNASTCEVALSSLSDPSSSTGHIVRYRISATSGGITVRLRQGTTTIATWTHATAPTSLTTYSQTLTGGEADSITDYTALRLQFEAT